MGGERGRTPAAAFSSRAMKGAHRFSPTSGAELSDDRHRPGSIPLRESLDESGELTNGRLVSETDVAITRYFRRMHQRHHDQEDVDLLRAAAADIKRLREHDPWDCWLWYALAERLHRRGFDVEWMLAHVEARCPRCSSQLKWEPSAAGYPFAKCASSCSREPEQTMAMMDRVLELFAAAFEPIDELTLV